jgi:pyrroline-5-carboxylate reductase
MVTSPGGTTAEALLTLEEEGLRGIIINAVIDAHEKAIALGEES